MYLDVPLTNVPLIVMAVCILHNLCIIHEGDIEDFTEHVEEEVNGFINIFLARAGGRVEAQPDYGGTALNMQWIFFELINM